MSSKLTLTNPVFLPPIDRLVVSYISSLDDNAKTMVIVLSMFRGTAMDGHQYVLEITNGHCDSVYPNPNPTVQDPFLQERQFSGDFPQMAAAWDTVWEGLVNGDGSADESKRGTFGILTALVSLGALPPGSVAAE